MIPCPNRCSIKLTRRDLPDHLQHDCPKRKVKCEFCGSEFTGEAYEVNTKHQVLVFFRSLFEGSEGFEVNSMSKVTLFSNLRLYERLPL